MIPRSSIFGMNIALFSVLVPAIVALVVSTISPVFTHLIWRRQKRKEQQVVHRRTLCCPRNAAMAAAVDTRDLEGCI